ncbi:MAG: dTMP kinase [Chloroflexota bacterium]
MFVTFEGVEGSGKSTQARLLREHLEARGLPVTLTREPGGTQLGEVIRELLLDATAIAVSPLAETLLFAAARAQLVATVIEPALGAGSIVVCDRYADSTVAYQVFGRGLARGAVEQVVRFATGGLVPDLTVLLDLTPDTGLSRKGEEAGDRFEVEAVAFHDRVRLGYLALAAEEPARWLVLDGALPLEDLASAIAERSDALISRREEA